MKKSYKKKDQTYIKIYPTPDLMKALQALSESNTASNSAIANTALQFYFKSEYPQMLPKDRLELENKAKDDYLYQKFYDKYKQEQTRIEVIPIQHRELRDAINKREQIKNKIESIKDKMRVIGVGKKEKTDFKRQLAVLQNDKESNEQIISDFARALIVS